MYNSTRSTYGLISDCNTGTNTITLTANVDAGWQVGDTITIRSQTNTATVGTSYFVDYEITSSEIDTLTRALDMGLLFRDTGAANELALLHPWEANSDSKRDGIRSQAANIVNQGIVIPVPIIQSRFCAIWTGSGSGTVTFNCYLRKENVAAP